MNRPPRPTRLTIVALAVAALLPIACGGRAPVADWPRMRRTEAIAPGAVVPDPAIAAMLAPYAAEVSKLRVPLARSNEGYTLQPCEGKLGNMIADMTRERAARLIGKPVDFVAINCGGIRAAIPAGDITREDAFKVLPFDNRIVVLEVEGRLVTELAKRLARSKGRFPLSNARLTHDKAGRLIAFEIDGEPVQPNRIYRLATIDFLVKSMDKDSRDALFAGFPPPILTGRLIREEFELYLEELTAQGNTLDGPDDGDRYTNVDGKEEDR